MNETYAQWNEQLQRPYNEQPKSQIKLPYSSGQEYRMTPAQLARKGFYRVQRIALAEGERLDNETWDLINDVITQFGTVIDAQTVIAEKQAARLAEIERLAAEFIEQPHAVSAVTLLDNALGLYGLGIPCGGYKGALAAIGQMDLSTVQQQMLGSLDTLYRAALSVCQQDDVITAVHAATTNGGIQ